MSIINDGDDDRQITIRSTLTVICFLTVIIYSLSGGSCTRLGIFQCIVLILIGVYFKYRETVVPNQWRLKK